MALAVADPASRRRSARTTTSHPRAAVELFGEPERWGDTTRSVLWTERDVLVPSFTGSTTFEMPVPCSYDLELASPKYLYALPDGEVPLAFHFSGTVFYRGDDGRLQLTKVPWSADGAVPAAGRDLAADWPSTTRPAATSPGRTRRSRPCAELRASGLPVARRRRWPTCAMGADERVTDQLEELVDSLLYEGYALYPYTPEAPRTRRPRRSGSSTRRRTPRRPPAPTTTCRCTCVLGRRRTRALSAQVRFLQPRGERHQAVPAAGGARRPGHRASSPSAR